MNKKPFYISRKAGKINPSSHLSKHYTLCELAPFQRYTLPVAGLHWAHPSTSLDKSNIIKFNPI
jgi:hypothetical protein